MDDRTTNSSTALVDTAERSLAHWSADGRAEMEAFYVLATEDYRHLAEAADWVTLLGRRARPGWQLLDVACGSGKFPTALDRYAAIGSLPVISYDLLDPSAFSVAEAKDHLRPPFVAGRELVMTLQDLPAELGPYDVVWAVHALYALPPDELAAAAARLVRARRADGLGVVAHATRRSHYLAVYDAYRSSGREVTPYLDAAEISAALQTAGADVREQLVRYRTGSPDRAVVEGFLQRCLFDDTISLDAMESSPVLGEYLAGCRSAEGSYSFEHEVALLWF